MALATIGKLRRDGSMYYFDSTRQGNTYCFGNADQTIYLINKGGDLNTYDWWVVGGTIYFGHWKTQSWMKKVVDLTTS